MASPPPPRRRRGNSISASDMLRKNDEVRFRTEMKNGRPTAVDIYCLPFGTLHLAVAVSPKVERQISCRGTCCWNPAIRRWETLLRVWRCVPVPVRPPRVGDGGTMSRGTRGSSRKRRGRIPRRRESFFLSLIREELFLSLLVGRKGCVCCHFSKVNKNEEMNNVIAACSCCP